MCHLPKSPCPDIAPAHGTAPSKPGCSSSTLHHTGMDFTGPFPTKWVNPRKPVLYVCIFICLSTKAVHVEFCSDLSTEAFPDVPNDDSQLLYIQIMARFLMRLLRSRCFSSQLNSTRIYLIYIPISSLNRISLLHGFPILEDCGRLLCDVRALMRKNIRLHSLTIRDMC